MTTPAAPAARSLSAAARFRLRACRTTSCPSLMRAPAAARPSPSVEPAMKIRGTGSFFRRWRDGTGRRHRANGSEGCGLRPLKFEYGNGADSGSLAFVPGKAWVAPRLLGVDAVAFGDGQFADGHLVCVGSAFDTAVTGGGQVVV